MGGMNGLVSSVTGQPLTRRSSCAGRFNCGASGGQELACQKSLNADKEIRFQVLPPRWPGCDQEKVIVVTHERPGVCNVAGAMALSLSIAFGVTKLPDHITPVAHRFNVLAATQDCLVCQMRCASAQDDRLNFKNL
jgi:hypothetical protein